MTGPTISDLASTVAAVVPTPQPPGSAAVDAAGAAALLKVSRSTWCSLDAAGLTPLGFRLGRCRRWLKSELIEWAAAGCPSRAVWETRKGRRP